MSDPWRLIKLPKILSMFSLTKPPCVNGVVSISPHIFLRTPNHPLVAFTKPTQFTSLRSSVSACASLDEKNPVVIAQDEVQSTPNMEVEESVALLKKAAKTRNVPDTEILSALKLLEKAKLDPSQFCETLGGSESPGKTWMLVYTAQKGLKSGKFFPVTAVQRFDAAARRIENGVYLGPLGCLTFEGRFSWKKRILAFVFELIRIKIGPFNPLEINIKGSDESKPTTKNPFFIWFYIDEEIAVARGRSGGTAFWCRCRRVNSF